MQQYLPYIKLLLLTTLILALTGCNASATLTSLEPTQVPMPTQTSLPTQAPEPTATTEPTLMPTPTEVVPIPCSIVFETNRDGNWEVYSMAADGSTLLNLSNNPADDFAPVWSPDGSQVAFVSNRENGAEGGQFIYIMNADGSAVRQLSLENESKWPDWSHDGTKITYTHQGDIYVIYADGSSPAVNITNSAQEEIRSVFSPDNNQLLWLSGTNGNWDLVIANIDGSNPTQVTFDAKVTGATWSVDGRIFLHWDNREAGCFNCIMNADGSNVADAGGKGTIQEFLPFWDQDGNRVECVSIDLDGNDEIYLIGEMYPDIFYNLTNHPSADRNPDWPYACILGR